MTSGYRWRYPYPFRMTDRTRQNIYKNIDEFNNIINKMLLTPSDNRTHFFRFPSLTHLG